VLCSTARMILEDGIGVGHMMAPTSATAQETAVRSPERRPSKTLIAPQE